MIPVDSIKRDLHKGYNIRITTIVTEWIVPFTEGFKQRKKGEQLKGIDAHDYELMWIVQDCNKCSERDKKIAQMILDSRLKELEDLY